MTHYYLYIQAGVQLGRDTRFYKVGIGQSAAQAKIHSWLEAYAAEHGHLFVIWSIDSADFYTKCSQSIGVDAWPLVTLSGANLMRSLKNGCEDPACWSAIQSRHRLLMQIDPSYYTYHELSRRNHGKNSH